MKYYSKAVFIILIVINIIAVIFASLVFFISVTWVGAGVFLMDTTSSFYFLNSLFNSIFILIPPLFFIFSTIIIALQQKVNKKFGYFMAISVFILSFFIILMQITWGAQLNFLNELFSMPRIWLLFWFIYLLAAFTPFYVVGRLIKEDLFKN
jgi:hypothetical protein